MHNFSLLIIDWYRQNKRALPWREINDPYKIWLSEIILQQTRVDQGLAYYKKFTQNYPSVHDLAQASEQDVLNDWQGLGYYSRARNLHFSAKYIVDKLDGKFPSEYSEILKLKGVGNYTAAAIASFAFNQPKAVVDGNVYRFLGRAFNIHTPIDTSAGQKEFQQLADELIPKEFPGDHNQAMMEIGATVCTPNQPDCENCPVNTICEARKSGTIQLLPVKSKKTKVRSRYFHFQVFLDGEKTILEKRTEKDIWQQMYQFPLVESTSTEFEPEHEIEKVSESEVIIHKLSHQHIHAVFHIFKGLPELSGENQIKINMEEIQEYPLPRIIDRYLEQNYPKV